MLFFPEDWIPVKMFFADLHKTILCYLPDYPTSSLPVIHSHTLDVSHQKQGYGIFYSVNGFKNAGSRRTSNLVSLNAFYIDIDCPTGERAKNDVLEFISTQSLAGFPPTWIIETKNGYHCLWLLDTPLLLLEEDTTSVILKKYHSLQQKLATFFCADMNAIDVTRVLRLPNTFHLKDPQSPFLVKIIHHNPEALYSFDSIEEKICSLAAPLPTFKTGRSSASTSSFIMSDAENYWKNAAVHKEAQVALSAEAFKELRKEYPKSSRPSLAPFLKTTGIQEGARNASLFIAASALREDGYTEHDVLLQFSEYSGLSTYEISQTIKSAFRSPSALSFGWNHPLIAPYVTTMEKTRVRAILSSYMKISRKERLVLAKWENTEIRKDRLLDTVQAQKEQQIEKRKKQMEKQTQTEIFQKYEYIFQERNPNIKYIEELDECYEYQEKKGFFSPVSTNEIKRRLLREMELDKMYAFRTVGKINDKILCFYSLKEIRMSQSTEKVLVSQVCVKNGNVDMATGILSSHSMNPSVLCSLPITYLPEKNIQDIAPRWLRFMDEITEGDKDKIIYLQEIMGYCFTRSIKYHKAFIFYGLGGNGKSTFVDILQKILTEKKQSSLTLHDIQKNFMLHTLFGKTLNVIEEIDQNYINSALLLKIISGGQIVADRKFKNSISFRPYAKFVFTVNNLPKINDTTMGLYRRLSIVNFKANFVGKEDTALGEKLWEERDGIFLWAVEGWKRVTSNNGFTVPESTLQNIEAFKKINSPLIGFILQEYKVAETSDEAATMYIKLSEFFQAYRINVKNMGYQPKAYQTFLSELSSLTHIHTKFIKIKEITGDKYVFGLCEKKKSFFDKGPDAPWYMDTEEKKKIEGLS